MAKTNPRTKARMRRKMHIRKTVRGSTLRPRLSVFRSANHIYAQVINDETGTTLASASSASPEFAKAKGHKGNKEFAAKVGELLAKKAIAAGVETIAFDRNGFLYHGRVQALADAARQAGLKF
jgi:large subunit ribosomal protein L18